MNRRQSPCHAHRQPMSTKAWMLVLALLLLATATRLAAQSYRNPVIAGFHPDPSICRVGDTFYLVNSSFNYFPGVPLYASRDLVHWRLVGNVLDRPSQLDLTGASSWTGIYAPTLRYHDGRYYMITTNVGHGGNFLVTATRPEGPWSEPVWLSQQGIDPSLYFESGHCYMVSNPDGAIALCEIDPTTGKQLTPSKKIWGGTGGRYPEGPHIYNKDGYYYLLLSEGGTELAHHLTIARSRHIDGPYEPCPDNPILTNCNHKGESKQIQGTGHGDLVEAADGSWWLVFLAYRNMGGSYHHLGRETCLAPVDWPKGGWPVVYGGEAIDTLMTARLLSQQPTAADDDMLAPDNKHWVYLQNPDTTRYQWLYETKSTQPSGLRLYGSPSTLTQNDRPTFIGRRQEAERMTCSVDLTATGDTTLEAGLTVYQIHDGHYDLFVKTDGEGRLRVGLRYEIKGLPHNTFTVPLASAPLFSSIRLRITSTNNEYVFAYSTDRVHYHEVGCLVSTLLSTEVVGGFTGITLGMYATGNGHADFANWSYQPAKE